MDVQDAVRRYGEQLRAQDLAVGHRDDDLRFEPGNYGNRSFISEIGGLHYRQAELLSSRLHRGRLEAPAPACGAIGLRDDVGDLVAILYEAPKRGHGEMRGSDEDYGHVQ